MSSMSRSIKPYNLTKEYTRISTVDPGNGQGEGNLNAGVFIVRRKRDDFVCVEKRISSQEVALGGNLLYELYLLRRLHHPNIVRFIDAFITLDACPPAASLYVEFCSLMSFESLIERVAITAKRLFASALLPEFFMWCAFRDLARALVYLRCGSTDPHEIRPAPGWRALLHRDIKPGNVLMRLRTPVPGGCGGKCHGCRACRSRAADRAAAGGGEYPTVVLGDFGLALGEDDPEWAWRKSEMCGCLPWLPPELGPHDVRGRGDVWGVGAVMQALCRLDTGPVALPPPRGVRLQEWLTDPCARRPRSVGPPLYSRELDSAVAMALELDVRRRPDACQLLRHITQLFHEAQPHYEPLPPFVFA